MSYRTVAVAMVKDEADIIVETVGHMMMQVDRVIVADNMSDDATPLLLEGLGVEVLHDHEIAYRQSAKMTALAQLALDVGADWVIPFDADELWTCQWGRIGDVLEQHSPDYGLVTAEVVDHVATGQDPTAGDVIDRLPWRRRDPLPLVKVACRATRDLVIEQGNHWARYNVPARPTETPAFTIHHFPRRSVAQFIHKARIGSAAYAAADDIPAAFGAHWRQWGQLSDEQLTEVFEKYYWRADPLAPIMLDGEEQPPLVFDPPKRCLSARY